MGPCYLKAPPARTTRGRHCRTRPINPGAAGRRDIREIALTRRYRINVRRISRCRSPPLEEAGTAADKAAAAIRGQLDLIKPAWPSLLYGAAARTEIATLKLKG